MSRVVQPLQAPNGIKLTQDSVTGHQSGSGVYSLYVPKADHFIHDRTIKLSAKNDDNSVPTWDITCDGKVYEDCKLLVCYPPEGRKTVVFECEKDGCRTIIKDYWVDEARVYNECDLLKQVHAKGIMPGVVQLLSYEVVKDNMEQELRTAREASSEPKNQVARRKRIRLVLKSFGEPLTKVGSLKQFLKVMFDLNEVHRAIYHQTGVLHRDISANNVLIRPVQPHVECGQYNPTPVFIADILRPFKDKRTEDTSSCLLIDFDNAAEVQAGTYTSEVLAHRTGTPMYIARAVSLGHILGYEEEQRAFVPMPKLSEPLKALYEQTWGAEVYKRYCDDKPGHCHGAEVPDGATLEDRFEQAKHRPTYHQLRHDAESIFWTFFAVSIQLMPKGDVEDDINTCCKFSQAWDILTGHQIPPAPSGTTTDSTDSRDDLFLNKPLRLHPVLRRSPLPALMKALAAQVVPEYELLTGIPHEDHLHEAIRRILLTGIVEMEHEDDIIFDTEKLRRPQRLNSRQMYLVM